MKPTEIYDPQTLHEVQSWQLVILDEVARICDKHGLTWFLDAGTALGAMRHGGFIPWDDDVDVSLLREDYDRFLEIAPRELPAWLRLDDPAKIRTMPSLFAKVCLNDSVFATQETIDAGYDQGIFIDIFYYDLVAEDEQVRASQIAQWKRATYMKYLYFSPHSNVPHSGALGMAERCACNVAHALLARTMSVDSFDRMMEHVRKMGREGAAPHDPLITLDYGRVPMRMSSIVPCTKAPFAGREYPVPAKVDDFLVNTYKNWHELPPEEKRHTHKPVHIVFPRV